MLKVGCNNTPEQKEVSMKKRFTTILALVLSLILCLSLFGCADKSKPGGGGSDMTQKKWEAAFAKSDSFANRTVTFDLSMTVTLMYNGSPVTENTKIGDSMTGAELLAIAGSMLGTSDEKEKYLVDTDNGKVNIVKQKINGSRERTDLTFYRLNGAKIEETDYRVSDEPYVDKYVYGPYNDATIAKSLLSDDASLTQRLDILKITDKNGQPLDIVKSSKKFTYSKGSYNTDLSVTMEFPVPLSGKGKVKVTDDYISSLEMNVKGNMDMSEYSFPRGVALDISAKGELKIFDVGTTAVNDEGLLPAEEENTYKLTAITTEEQFKSIFRNLEDGIGFEFYDRNAGTNYTVELKQTASGYNAYVREDMYDSDAQEFIYKHYYYIVTAGGIQKYEGKSENIDLDGWKEPTKISDTSTLDALCAYFPAVVGDYFAAYDDGKTVSELYSKFRFVGFTSFGAQLKNGTKTVNVVVYFNNNGDRFYLDRILFDDGHIDSIISTYYLGIYNPLTYGQN